MTTQQAAEAAARAHTDLNIFGGIALLLEGSLLSVESQRDEFVMVAQCRRAEQNCLRRYDAAMAVLSAKPK